MEYYFQIYFQIRSLIKCYLLCCVFIYFLVLALRFLILE